MSYIIFTIFIIFGTLQGLNGQCNPTVTTASGTYAPNPICAGQLIFEDTFDWFDLRKWQHESTLAGGGNNEFQWYTNSRYNSFVENGILYLKPTLLAEEGDGSWLYTTSVDINGGYPAEQCTNPYNNGCYRQGTADSPVNPIKSARIRTVNSFSFKYGRLEIRAKLPAGDWLWPAIWMLPTWMQYSGWPSSGEIDIMESRGNRDMTIDGGHIGTHLIENTLHWGPRYDINMFMTTHWSKTNDAGWDTDFHRYQLDWTPDYLKFLVDDEETGIVYPPEGGFWEMGGLDSSGLDNPWKSGTKMAPFDQEFYLMINLAVGGTSGFFPDNVVNPGGKPWSNTSPRPVADFWENRNQWLPTWQLETNNAAFQIDYVRIWAQ